MTASRTPRTPAASRAARTLFLVVALTLGLAACTPSQLAAFLAEEPKHRDALTDRQLLKLRQCESSDNYQAKSANRRYFGAYQFSRATWNDVAGRYYPWLERLGPHKAAPIEQDAMARALWDERGAAPWPYCGQRVGPR
ncbi:MAG: transglycosylase family protein [Acidimicrobiales bacterium]|nr:transglycosylase family protein [Acidimicrobiales bacterium]MCB1017448.1 transglycosylase family protein [Acidimicrobiales bacterium]MCB9372911.1 transglycosylase family protein [Microthrixaceae bacterium]